MNSRIIVSILLFCAITTALMAETEMIIVKDGEPGALSQSLVNEGQAAVDRGIKWLVTKQNEEGYWSSPEFPALTALPLWAIAKSGTSHPEAVDKAVKYILSCVHEDGSIWKEPSEKRKGGGLSNYNTAICMVALQAVGQPTLSSTIHNARRFIAGTQHLGDDVYKGGMGYDPKTGRPYADLSNSYIAYEAMRLTEGVDDLRTSKDKKVDLDWEAAQEFIARVQNMDESDDPAESEEKGGFIYMPGASKAGTYTNSAGEVRFRTYGGMTYAGLLSLIYADVDKDDVRVKSAFDWAEKHWTLNENPGIGQEGLFYFYNVLSKGLAAYGQDTITLEDGSKLNWRAELIKKLVSLQKIDPKTGAGYWINENGRWWEADPILVTSYSLIALEVALSE